MLKSITLIYLDKSLIILFKLSFCSQRILTIMIIFLYLSLKGKMTIFSDIGILLWLASMWYSKLNAGMKFLIINFIEGISKHIFNTLKQSISTFMYSSEFCLIKITRNFTGNKIKREKVRIISKYFTVISLNLFS